MDFQDGARFEVQLTQPQTSDIIKIFVDHLLVEGGMRISWPWHGMRREEERKFLFSSATACESSCGERKTQATFNLQHRFPFHEIDQILSEKIFLHCSGD